MHSSTPSYLSIQGLYRNQFKQDLQDFRVKLRSVLSQVGLPEDAIPESELESFVKNTNGVALVKGSSVASRRVVGGELKASIGDLIVSSSSLFNADEATDDNFGLDDWPVTYGTPLHLAFLAADHSYSSLGRWPGTDEASYQSDLEKVQSTLADLVQKAKPSVSEVPVEVQHCAQEM